MPVDVRSRYRGTSDIGMRHSDTYVGYRNNDGSVGVYRVTGVDGSMSDPILILDKVHGEGRQRLNAHLATDDNLITDRPDCGFANVTSRDGIKVALYYSTHGRRQYKRSLSNSSLSFLPVMGSDMDIQERVMHYLERGHYAKAIYTFYNDEYPQFQRALQSLRTTGTIYSIAFSKKFALCLHDTKGIVLYYKNSIVGYVSERRPMLVPAYSHLQEQLDEVVPNVVE